ncbi:hypothetical protein T05_2419 [Trichinella murrelli]|uniref:Uncharacterized protein n=1 Tax=Trichinella murrelli TaxID=144512 RepID=A0A0V0TV06_9BILA|nr:hypothetical protein T05_2419 [Trichinella murrelli]
MQRPIAENYAFNELISICQWLDYEALTIATSIKARRIAQHKLAAKIASCKRLRAQLCWQSGHFDQFNLTGNENVQQYKMAEVLIIPNRLPIITNIITTDDDYFLNLSLLN